MTWRKMENCKENNLINFRVEEKRGVFPFVLVTVYYIEKDLKRNMSKLLNCIWIFHYSGPEGLKLLFIKKYCTLSEFMKGRVYILLWSERILLILSCTLDNMGYYVSIKKGEWSIFSDVHWEYSKFLEFSGSGCKARFWCPVSVMLTAYR